MVTVPVQAISVKTVGGNGVCTGGEGTRQGTGGSSGAEYLQSTLLKPLFPDLWEIRTNF
jgi:hypothetical protein